eukprot:CAMPEP_0179185740 /NCGR_PEP_ID=MMETSP0796-20121207/92109_1 /TAXON_ID=73915 /ORGANISM="Pyrodinium bahamense, Strain pbaha01" /LENGTH=33 /DNA_ID= /DNA_START= /DNA_END= /DNA_ORIENTATION=
MSSMSCRQDSSASQRRPPSAIAASALWKREAVS